MPVKKDQNPGNPADPKYETVTRTYDNQKEGEPYITAEFSKTDAGTTFDVGDEKYYSREGISTEAKRKRRALPRKLDIQLFLSTKVVKKKRKSVRDSSLRSSRFRFLSAKWGKRARALGKRSKQM